MASEQRRPRRWLTPRSGASFRFEPVNKPTTERSRASLGEMKRVVILGPGASGKSTLAVLLGEITGLGVIELDKIFWLGLVPTPRDQWVKIQQALVQADGWIMDGDLGPDDGVEVRLRAADTVIFLDFSLVRCAWRALRRSRASADFWLWLLRYRRQSRPFLIGAIANHAAHATLHVLRNPKALRRFVADVVGKYRPWRPGCCCQYRDERRVLASPN